MKFSKIKNVFLSVFYKSWNSSIINVGSGLIGRKTVLVFTYEASILDSIKCDFSTVLHEILERVYFLIKLAINSLFES